MLKISSPFQSIVSSWEFLYFIKLKVNTSLISTSYYFCGKCSPFYFKPLYCWQGFHTPMVLSFLILVGSFICPRLSIISLYFPLWTNFVNCKRISGKFYILPFIYYLKKRKAEILNICFKTVENTKENNCAWWLLHYQYFS